MPESKLQKSQNLFIIIFAGMMLFGMHFLKSHLGGDSLDLPFNAMVWIFASGLIATGLWTVGSQQKIIFNKPILIIAIGALGLWIPLLYPNEMFGEFALGRLIGLMAGVMLMLTVLQMQFNERQWNLIFWLILAGVLIQALVSLMIFYEVIISWLFKIKMAGNVASGIFAQRNVASTFLLFGLFSAAWLLIANKQLNRWQLFLILSALFFAMWSLALNVSRSGHIGLLAVILLTAPLLYKKANTQYLRMFYLILIAGLAMPQIAHKVGDFPTQTRESVTPSGVRISMWTVGSQMILERPLSGWGYGQTDAAFADAQGKYIASGDYELIRKNNVSHPHNEILYWGIEGGLLPIAILLALAIYISMRLFSLPWQKSLFLLAGIFPVLFHSMLEYPFYHGNILWVLFCLILGKILLETDNQKSATLPSNFAPQLFAMIFFISTLIYMSLSIQSIGKIVSFKQSGNKDFKQLEQIISPMSQITRYGFIITNQQFTLGLLNKDTEQLTNYIAWHNQVRWRVARATFYQRHYIALEVLGKKAEATKLLEYAKSIFGMDHPLFQNLPRSDIQD